MKNLVFNVDPVQFGLEKKQVEEITKGLKTILEERDVLIEAYKDVILLEVKEENLKTFKELRLMIVKNRTQGLKKWHKANKAYFLAGGNFVQAIYNKEVAENERMEAQLMQAEKHFENLEKERLKKLQDERANKLSLYVEDAHERDLVKFEDDEFEALLAMKKKEQEDRIAAEKKAEQERIAKEKAEAEERERIRKENEQLRKEAEQRERLAKIEAEKRAKEEAERKAKEEAERKAREEKERKEREAYEAKLKAEREERERIEREERVKREKLEAELKAKQEAERKAKEEEEKRLAQIEADKQAELNKGDAAKVKDLISELEFLKTKFVFKSKKNKKMYSDVGILISKVIDHIK